MPQPLVPLLVLAWDDDDTSPHQPNEGAPTLPLLRDLAARLPLLAILPQLPEAVRSETRLAELAQAGEQRRAASASAAPTGKAEAIAEEAIAPAAPTPDAAEDAALTASGPAPSPAAPADAAPGKASPQPEVALPSGIAGPDAAPPMLRVIGLADVGFVTKTSSLPLTAPRPDAPMHSVPPVAGLSAFVWPAAPRTGSYEVPAAPYLGSTPTPPPLPPPYPSVPPPPAPPQAGAGSWHEPPGFAQPPQHVYDLAFDPDPELPLLGTKATGAPALSEPGPAEAAALDAPTTQLPLADKEALTPTSDAPTLPLTPERATLSEGLAALRRPASAALAANSLPSVPTPAVKTQPAPAPLSDDLHYRIIQYARFATHVGSGRGEDFGALYAPDWPVWLAALELRYRLRRPLVLHLSDLARDTAQPADRGWRLEIERYALRRAHSVFVTTPALRQRVLSQYGLRPERVRVLARHDAAGIAAALTQISAAARPADLSTPTP